MEKQDVQVGQINALQGASLGDQLGLKLMLQALSTCMEEQTAASKDQALRLENIENLMSQILNELIAIKEILPSTSSTDIVE